MMRHLFRVTGQYKGTFNVPTYVNVVADQGEIVSVPEEVAEVLLTDQPEAWVELDQDRRLSGMWKCGTCGARVVARGTPGHESAPKCVGCRVSMVPDWPTFRRRAGD
jgi:hypothetical protein